MKTPEELAEEWCAEHTCHLQMTCHANAFLAGYAAAQPKWISVKERLPRPGQEVLAFDDGIFRVQAISSNGTWHPYPNGRKCKPSHWCELPEPPKEEK